MRWEARGEQGRLGLFNMGGRELFAHRKAINNHVLVLNSS